MCLTRELSNQEFRQSKGSWAENAISLGSKDGRRISHLFIALPNRPSVLAFGAKVLEDRVSFSSHFASEAEHSDFLSRIIR